MNIFKLRNDLINEYNAYISSFVHIQDQRIRNYVQQEVEEGLLWPNPLIQLNPSYELGSTIDDLISEGILDRHCSQIFRLNKNRDNFGEPMRLFRHQEQAIRIAQGAQYNYVLTTGTGSGKSLAYIIPVVNHILQQGAGRGIQAIFVYPMNALANSQLGELEKFLGSGPSSIRFERYTGQESEEKKQEIMANPPDILLTNYVMLELILTRPAERNTIINSTQNLRFLILDELHTYRGRQGSDVALLVRRLRNSIRSSELCCIGTSATLATEGSFSEQQSAIARVASKLFGTVVNPEHIIGETLTRISPDINLNDQNYIESLRQYLTHQDSPLPVDNQAYTNHPLVRWIESTFGVVKDPASDWLKRATPTSIYGESGAANNLAQLTGISVDVCGQAIEKMLLAAYDVNFNIGDEPPFAFRLHQFISRGDTIYASLEQSEDRYITARGQQFVPGDRSKILLPMVFCRECGQEYYSIFRNEDAQADGQAISPREFFDFQDSDEFGQAGYLFFSENNPWPLNEEDVIERLPDEWLETYGETLRVRPGRRKYLPELMHVSTDGKELPQGLGFFFFANPFRFCMNCGVAYDFRQRSDIPKLATVGAGGRSTATTILALAAIKGLDTDGSLPEKARKLLSFTDNRQDAALQSGHFNDFVQVSLLRAALYQAVALAGSSGLTHDALAQKVFDALGLAEKSYAADPEVEFQAKYDTQKAFRDVLGYQLYHDLRRGWRVTSPNLEQCGLLEIEYPWLAEVCSAEHVWQDMHPLWVTANPETRMQIAKVLLDYMRRELVIRVEYLNRDDQERIKQRSYQYLQQPWAIEENEELAHAAVLYPRQRRDRDYLGNVFLSPRGAFGQYLRNTVTFENYPDKLSLDETEQIITELLKALQKGGLVSVVDQPRDEDVPGYQLSASAMVWKQGTGERAFHDPIRVPHLPETGGRTNAFFVKFYRGMAGEFKDLQAREHTAQVPYEDREKREEHFRAGELRVLFCSPTMELGIDIAQLNVVNLRNVPPNPANYAQRSGRAGRSGQPALVFTYCASGSPHDQYFFRRPEQMVAGAVSPPRLDLANEELLRSHLHAIWLSETGQSLHFSLMDLVDMEGNNPTLELLPSVRANIESQHALNRAREKGRQVLKTIEDDLALADWYHPDWLNHVYQHAARRFDAACDRWRNLYRAARTQEDVQRRIELDHSKSKAERNRAKRLRAEAVSQINLLTDSVNAIQSDFYSYRYFASEGFLPGYNFPRLPISAYIPARRIKTGQDEFLSRPRFLAISEFGPRAFVYHEGSRYQINRVIMPVSVSPEEEELQTHRAKICPSCGYLHPITHGDGLDRCESCDALLIETFAPLFRLQNVATKRRDRISSDEEERTRYGFELQTAVRFSEHEGRQLSRSAVILVEDEPMAQMTYGSAATLWRINLGWRRRSQPDQYGFVLDTEGGYWGRNESMDDDQDDPMGAITRRVIPYVEDRKNSLIFNPDAPLGIEEMASLMAALKMAIQLVFQVEDNELAAEPLPTDEIWRSILFFEAAEGGAGVLRQLLHDPDALTRVARKALEICHFDPDTGDDLGRAEGAREDCEAACYDCLLSYFNQRHHPLLDRHLIKDYLLALRDAQVVISPEAKPRGEHLQTLLNLCQSDLERQWLTYLDQNGYRLPSGAQPFIEACHTRPDFIYEEQHVVVYVDGYHHLFPDRQQRDILNTACLENLGYTVLRFGVVNDWEEIFANNTFVFGNKS